MPKDKTASHERIVIAAKAEFLEKGFEKASMRDIGERAGITPAGLYRHYKNKEDMFNELVKPALDSLYKWYKKHVDTKYAEINKGVSKNELFNDNMIVFMREEIYPYEDEFRLLFQCAQGTKYENFIHDIVRVQQKDLLKTMKFMKEKGMKVKEISEEEMHMIMSAYTTALFEPFIHNFSRERAEECLRTIEDFFMPGWQKLLGF